MVVLCSTQTYQAVAVWTCIFPANVQNWSYLYCLETHFWNTYSFKGARGHRKWSKLLLRWSEKVWFVYWYSQVVKHTFPNCCSACSILNKACNKCTSLIGVFTLSTRFSCCRGLCVPMYVSSWQYLSMVHEQWCCCSSEWIHHKFCQLYIKTRGYIKWIFK